MSSQKDGELERALPHSEKSGNDGQNINQWLANASRSLYALSAELEVIASLSPADNAQAKRPQKSRSMDEVELAQLARRAYQDRRRRAQIFDDKTMFGEPAWDIMLDLFIAACQDKRVAITSACIGADVPNTTALRWLSILEVKGLISRESDELDGRRTFVRLSKLGFDRMKEYFS
jgi:hypothetical protein